MKRKKKLGSFITGLIIAFSISIGVEAFLLYGGSLGFQSVDVSYLSEFPQREIQGEGPMEGKGRRENSATLSTPVNTGTEYTFDSTIYPYHAVLTDEEQAVYNQVYANALLANSDTFTLVNSLSEDELCDTMNAVFNDHPELFRLNTSYKYGYNNSKEAVQVQLSFSMSGDTLSSAKTNFDSIVSTIATNASAYSTDIEKELYIHDYINELASYNENASMNQSAYSALVNGPTVCAGYARAFQVVCQNAGITCYYVTGTASGGDHAWNIVSISGAFYNVDLTWDDSISTSYGSNVYTYFNLTDSAISVNHTRSELSSKLPTCTATEMSYTNVYGSTVEIDDIESSDDSQITDGKFTIDSPNEPVVDWRNTQTPPVNTNNMPAPPTNGTGIQNNRDGNIEPPQMPAESMENRLGRVMPR